MRALLTVWFCWRTSAAGSGRWWWEPPGWCTWSWPRWPPGFGSDCVSDHRSLSHRKAPTVTGSGVLGQNTHDYSCPPSWLWMTVGEISTGGLAWIKEGDGSGRKDSEYKQSVLFIPFLKKQKNTVTDRARCIDSRRTGFFCFVFLCMFMRQPWDFLSQHWQKRLGAPLTDGRPMWGDAPLTMSSHAWAEQQAD